MQTWKDLNLKVKIVDSKEKLEELFKKIKQKKEIVFDTETTSLNVMEASLV
jgi:hypothetical protein